MSEIKESMFDAQHVMQYDVPDTLEEFTREHTIADELFMPLCKKTGKCFPDRCCEKVEV